MKKRVVSLLLMVCLLLSFASETFAATAKVKTVSITNGGVCIMVGDTYSMKATVSPSNAGNKKLTWSSSNTKVATVNSNGVVTGKKAGTVTIKAVSKDNSKATASCKITVQNSPAVTSVKLDKTTVNMLGEKVTLKATCYPFNANQKVTWSSSNKKVATVTDKGVVTPKGYGTCTITAKADNGKTATCKITIQEYNWIEKSYEIAAQWPYKLEDHLSIAVDGLTGKIKAYDCYQETSDASFGFAMDIVGKGIKAYNVTKDYVEFRSNYQIKLGVGVGKLKVTGTVLTKTMRYRFDKSGKVTVITGN
ncbi:MAG: Ig domain-containing protein [Clostridia bacterium]|nr:Ig domain-containing protein [Clostridia bacterium]